MESQEWGLSAYHAVLRPCQHKTHCGQMKGIYGQLGNIQDREDKGWGSRHRNSLSCQVEINVQERCHESSLVLIAGKHSAPLTWEILLRGQSGYFTSMTQNMCYITFPGRIWTKHSLPMTEWRNDPSEVQLTECDDLNENDLHMFLALKVWSPVSRTLWVGLEDLALSEKICWRF